MKKSPRSHNEGGVIFVSLNSRSKIIRIPSLRAALFAAKQSNDLTDFNYSTIENNCSPTLTPSI